MKKINNCLLGTIVRPVVNNNYSDITCPTIDANDFKLKLELIYMVQQNRFRKASTDGLNAHRDFSRDM